MCAFCMHILHTAEEINNKTQIDYAKQMAC